METVLKPFLTRFAQPVILSFCIAWIFWNWEIVVGLIWYNATTLPKYTCYKNYKELIEANAIWQRNYLYPILVAVVYPYLRFGINYFNTVLETQETTQTLSASGSGKISTLKFLKLRQSYEDKIAELSQYFEDQSNVHMRLNEADTELIKIRNELQIAQQSLLEKRMSDQSTSELVIMKDRELFSLRNNVSELEKLNMEFRRQADIFSENEKMSKYESLEGGYELTLYKIQNDISNIIKRSSCVIAENSYGLEITIDEKKIGSVSKYIYNIINRSFVIMFSKYPEYDDEIWFSITDKYLFFNIDNQRNNRYVSDFNDESHYCLELKRIY